MTPEPLVVTLPFAPRPWQAPLMDDPHPHIVAVVHRRAGKSTALLWRGLRKALTLKREAPRVVHILPYQIQWKRTGLWDQAERASKSIPGAELRKSDMAIRLPNGGVWQAGGADNEDTWRGGYADECIVDEYDDTPRTMVPLVIEPMLADRDGVLVRSGTPKGNGLLEAAYDRARVTPGYSTYRLDYRQTRALPDGAIARLRREMTEEEFAQELECSFAAPNTGAYYGKLMADAEAEGRITAVPHDPLMPVWTAWDLGVDQATAIWFAQISSSGQWRVIDYLESSREGLEWYARQIRDKPYAYERHLLPHDVEVQELGSGRTRRDTLLALGIKPIRKVASGPGAVADGINAAQVVLPRCWFDAHKCAQGIRALRHYRREWSEEGQTWRSAPVKDWSSHAADGFRMLAVGVREKQHDLAQAFERPPFQPRSPHGMGWLGA